MKKILFVSSFFMAAALRASAMPSINAGVDQFFGTNEYVGTNVYAAFGGDHFSIAPEVKTFKNNVLNKRLTSFMTRMAYDTRFMGVGIVGGGTSSMNDYQAFFGGADVAVTLSPTGDSGIRRIGGAGRGGAPVGKGIARIDIGGGAMVTRHKLDATSTNASSQLTQTEFHGFVGASVLNILVSGRFSRFNYDTNPANLTTFVPSNWTPLAGLFNYSNGYAQSNLHLQAEWPIFPMVRPWVSYTFTDYEPLSLALGGKPGDTRAYTAGVRVGLDMVAVQAAYQHVNRSGAIKDNNFVTVGAQLRL